MPIPDVRRVDLIHVARLRDEHREQWLNRAPGKGVQKNDGRIVSITMLSGKAYRGKMFIDATYEGDLMAAAGVSYTLGREANSQYRETLSGVATKYAKHHQFAKPVDPYVRPGDPSSGLLPGVMKGGPGKEGAADKRIQAYCFRMCLTNVAANRVPLPKPEGYDPNRYQLLLRTILAEANPYGDQYFMTSAMPNGKTDSNNKGPFSTDNIGMNYDYPEGDYATRQRIIQEHETYQKGFVWFLANDPRVPEACLHGPGPKCRDRRGAGDRRKRRRARCGICRTPRLAESRRAGAES